MLATVGLTIVLMVFSGRLWHDLPELNAYVARCQSILQSGRPANDVLLYFPVHDLWHAKRRIADELASIKTAKVA